MLLSVCTILSECSIGHACELPVESSRCAALQRFRELAENCVWVTIVAKGYVDSSCVILLPAVFADVNSMQACWAPQASHRVLACVVQVAGVGAHGQVCAFSLAGLTAHCLCLYHLHHTKIDVAHSPHVRSAITCEQACRTQLSTQSRCGKMCDTLCVVQGIRIQHIIRQHSAPMALRLATQMMTIEGRGMRRTHAAMGERSGRGCYQLDMPNDTEGGLHGAVQTPVELRMLWAPPVGYSTVGTANIGMAGSICDVG